MVYIKFADWIKNRTAIVLPSGTIAVRIQRCNHMDNDLCIISSAFGIVQEVANWFECRYFAVRKLM